MRGFNYENNKNNPRISKNSDEMTLCSVFVKEFKIGLHPILKYYKDGTLHQRLMSLFMAIKAVDPKSAPGSLNVGEGLRTLKGQLLLRQFVFNRKLGIRQQLGNPEVNETDFSLSWSDFDPSSIRFPSSATHFELQYLVLTYDNKRNIFTTYTAVPVRRARKDEWEVLELRTEKAIVKKKGVQYFLAIGLRFLEILGEEEYPLLGQNAVGIEVLGVY
ncbi:hypothetical protein K8089_02840 [Aequorivita sp. F47161]|uniref:Uncharacterized protein n=1 Tax=Aequorivita vitellina TaxID=2874475 RepID=A0A9X1QWK8_9FLAO|nr:hypothetical protein [Aequorivita vitellina]MCG2417944.1 hypothetical protein [Aequorivita vitellina]